MLIRHALRTCKGMPSMGLGVAMPKQAVPCNEREERTPRKEKAPRGTVSQLIYRRRVLRK